MTTCDEIRENLLLAGRLDAAATQHLRACSRCQQIEPVMHTLGDLLRADTVPDPPAGLTGRVLAVAGPVLAARAASMRPVVYHPRLARAVLTALLLLPVVLAFDACVARAAHALLRTLLPAALSGYLVFNYAALVVLLITCTYAAIPVLVDRQACRMQQSGAA